KGIRVRNQSIFLEREGMQLTLDGIAKGYIVDSAVAMLRRSGFSDVLVEAGGDLAASGQRSDGGPWRVGVRHPRAIEGASTQSMTTVEVSQRAVATSGDYMNSFTQDFSRHHIVDPRSGLSPQELSSVTVLAPTTMDADALSTTVMVLGLREGMTLLERLPHVAGLLVSKANENSDVKMWPTSNFPALGKVM
ncbi:MAG: FAD:protein FMN transferase, partial [Chloroflexota bacterium]